MRRDAKSRWREQEPPDAANGPDAVFDDADAIEAAHQSNRLLASGIVLCVAVIAALAGLFVFDRLQGARTPVANAPASAVRAGANPADATAARAPGPETRGSAAALAPDWGTVTATAPSSPAAPEPAAEPPATPAADRASPPARGVPPATAEAPVPPDGADEPVETVPGPPLTRVVPPATAEAPASPDAADEPVEMIPELPQAATRPAAVPGGADTPAPQPPVAADDSAADGAAAASAAAAPDPRTPPPDATAIRQAEQLVRELFKADFARAKSAAERLAVAEQMLSSLRQTNSAAERFVLLRVARDIAIGAGDSAIAVRAADLLSTTFRLDPLETRATAFLQAAEVPGLRGDRRPVAKLALELAREAVVADRFELANSLLTAGLAAARAADAFAQVREIVALKKDTDELAAQFRDIERARATLEQNPRDAEAHLAVGRYRALRKAQWDRGLPHLALGSDPTLRTLATLELRPPESPAECVPIADGWWELAQRESEPVRSHLLARAGLWYRWLEPRLDARLLKVRVQKRATETAVHVTDDAWAAFAEARGEPAEPREAPANTPPNRTGGSAPPRGDRPADAAAVELVVKYKCEDRDPRNNQIKPTLMIENRGRTPVPLEELLVRYWITLDRPQPFNTWCDYAQAGTDKVVLQFRRASPPRARADACFEIGFKPGAPALPPQKDSGPIQLRFALVDWANVDEANDYSFDPAQENFGESTWITLYRRGQLVWGSEPATAKPGRK